MTTKDDLRKQFEADLNEFAIKYSITSINLESYNFQRKYKLAPHGDLLALQSEKAIVRTHGRTVKIPIGENETHKTYEEAEKFAKEYWAEYTKKRRENWSPSERAAYLKRQKRYYEMRKQKELEISRRQ